MNPSSRTRDMLCIILQDDLQLAAVIVYSRGSDSWRRNSLMIASLLFACYTKVYPILSVDLCKNRCVKVYVLEVHVYAHTYKRVRVVSFEWCTKRMWQELASEPFRQFVAIKFWEWNMMKVEEYFSREKDTDCNLQCKYKHVPLIVSFVLWLKEVELRTRARVALNASSIVSILTVQVIALKEE